MPHDIFIFIYIIVVLFSNFI